MEVTYTIGREQTQKNIDSLLAKKNEYIRIDKVDLDRAFPASCECNSLTITSQTGAAEILEGFTSAAQGILSPSATNVALRISACDIKKIKFDDAMGFIDAVQKFMPDAKVIWAAGLDEELPDGAITLNVLADVADECQNK